MSAETSFLRGIVSKVFGKAWRGRTSAPHALPWWDAAMLG